MTGTDLCKRSVALTSLEVRQMRLLEKQGCYFLCGNLYLCFFWWLEKNNRLLWAFSNPGGNSMRVTASWLTRIRLPFWKTRFNTSGWLSPFSVKAQLSQSRLFSVGSAHLCCPSMKNAQSQSRTSECIYAQSNLPFWSLRCDEELFF